MKKKLLILIALLIGLLVIAVVYISNIEQEEPTDRLTLTSQNGEVTYSIMVTDSGVSIRSNSLVIENFPNQVNMRPVIQNLDARIDKLEFEMNIK